MKRLVSSGHLCYLSSSTWGKKFAKRSDNLIVLYEEAHFFSSVMNELLCFGFPLRIAISFDEALSGVACNLDSRGFHVLCKATEEAVGHVKPYSITGSLPLIRELQVTYGFPLFSFSFSSNCVSFFFFNANLLYIFTHLILCGRRKALMFKLQAMV